VFPGKYFKEKELHYLNQLLQFLKRSPAANKYKVTIH